MCGPFALPLALLAAGTGAKFIGAKQAERASNRTFEAERQRQKIMENQQHASFEDSLAKARQLSEQVPADAATDARNNTLAAAIVPSSTAGSYLPGSSSAPAVVADAGAASAARSNAVSSHLARALATLGGQGDELQRVGIDIGRNSQNIGQIGGFKAGSAAVLDAEMKAAAQKGSFLRGIGGLAQQIGMMAIPGAGAGHGLVNNASASVDKVLANLKMGAV